jgi:hypothetical protein
MHRCAAIGREGTRSGDCLAAVWLTLEQDSGPGGWLSPTKRGEANGRTARPTWTAARQGGVHPRPARWHARGPLATSIRRRSPRPQRLRAVLGQRGRPIKRRSLHPRLCGLPTREELMKKSALPPARAMRSADMALLPWPSSNVNATLFARSAGAANRCATLRMRRPAWIVRARWLSNWRDEIT